MMTKQRMGSFVGIRKRAYRRRKPMPDMSAAWRDAQANLHSAPAAAPSKYWSVKWTRPMHPMHGRRFLWHEDGKFPRREDAVEYAERYLRDYPGKGSFEIVEWREGRQSGSYPVSDAEWHAARSASDR